MPDPNKTCGECTLCCKLLGVTEIEKSANEWCKHCDKGKGCRIYEERPKSCRDFECVWLQVPHSMMPDSLRPDRCKVILTEHDEKTINAHVDPGYPGIWRDGLMGRLLNQIANNGLAVLIKDANGRRIAMGRMQVKDLIQEKQPEPQS